MPTSKIDQELAVLRSLAARGDYQSDLITRTFDAMRADNKQLEVVIAATTANRTLSGLTSTVLDGVTPTDGQLILVKSQTSAIENGIYKAHAGAWTRLVDDNGDYVLVSGMLVSITQGSTLQDTLWELTTDTFVVGTDNIAFAQFAASLAAATLTPLQQTVADANGLAAEDVIRVSMVAAGPGVADDVVVYTANAPFAFRVIDTYMNVVTAIGGKTVTVRDAAAGGGNAMSDAMSAASTGVVRNTTLTTTRTIALNGSLVVRRSDNGVAGEVFIKIMKV